MKQFLLPALLASTAFLAVHAVFAQPAAPALAVAAESTEMIWNAIAVDRGRIFVAGPRWTGSKGPALALIGEQGDPQPYPDAQWNSWQPGAATAGAFVNINAIHLDRKGSLWVVDTGSPDFGGDPLPGGAKLVKIDLATNRVTRVYPLGPDIAKPGSYVDDIRFKGDIGYLTDAGRPGLIVFNALTGEARRVLDDHPSTTAPADRPIILDGAVAEDPGRLAAARAQRPARTLAGRHVALLRPADRAMVPHRNALARRPDPSPSRTIGEGRALG